MIEAWFQSLAAVFVHCLLGQECRFPCASDAIMLTGYHWIRLLPSWSIVTSPINYGFWERWLPLLPWKMTYGISINCSYWWWVNMCHQWNCNIHTDVDTLWSLLSKLPADSLRVSRDQVCWPSNGILYSGMTLSNGFFIVHMHTCTCYTHTCTSTPLAVMHSVHTVRTHTHTHTCTSTHTHAHTHIH